mmetsp:Transcript_12215/g.22899  ORF Transcript_12215/g.22899 Transcript_12215/m.22899 type:complete len:1667 (-) Transcript_12215:19-5019(-)
MALQTKRETCTIYDDKKNRITTGTTTSSTTSGQTVTRIPPSRRRRRRRNSGNQLHFLNSINNDGMHEKDKAAFAKSQKLNATSIFPKSKNDDETSTSNSSVRSCDCHGEFCSLVQLLDVNRDLTVAQTPSPPSPPQPSSVMKNKRQHKKYENGSIMASKQHDCIDGRTRAYKILKKVLKKEEFVALEDSGYITRLTIKDKIRVDQIHHQSIPRQSIKRSKLELRCKFLALQDMDEEEESRGNYKAMGADNSNTTISTATNHTPPGTGLVPVCDMCFHVYRLLTQVRCLQDESFCKKVLGTDEDVTYQLTCLVEKVSGTLGKTSHQQQQQQQQQQRQHNPEIEKEGNQHRHDEVDLFLSDTDNSDGYVKTKTKASVDCQSEIANHTPKTTSHDVSESTRGNGRHQYQRSKKKIKSSKIPTTTSSSKVPCITLTTHGKTHCGTSNNYHPHEIKTFVIDDFTEIVYCVMTSVVTTQSHATSKKLHYDSGREESSNLIVCHDLFETLERMQIFLSHFMEHFVGHKMLLWNYAGQAYTKFSEKQCLNNEYHAQCLEKLMDHIGAEGTKEFIINSSPYFVMGHGQGASIACLYAKARQHPNLKGLLLINPLSFIDKHYASVIHDCRNIFQCAPEQRPDLPIYFYSRFLFSEKYLQKTSTALALNLYTAIHNPITLNGRIRLCDGVLNNVDLRDKVKNLFPPIVSVHGDDSSLVRSLHAASFVESRESCSTLHHALYSKSGKRTIVIMMEGGHDLLQERKKNIHSLIEQLLTGKIVDHQGGTQYIAQNSNASDVATSTRSIWSSHPSAFSQLVETVSDAARKDDNPTHSTPKKRGGRSSYKNDTIDGARKLNRDAGREKEKGKQLTSSSNGEMLLLNPNDPAFERHKNSIYKPTTGSIIYSMDVDGKSKQEYMSWRLRRNRKRLSRFQRAAKVIQDALRVYMAKTMLARLKRQTSALTIQRVYRGTVGRTIVLYKRRELWAACFVQRVYRGSLGRKTCYFTRVSMKSQVNIARIWRGYHGRKRVQQIFFHRVSAATQLQSMWRRFLATQQVKILKIQHYSAIVIQKYFRAYRGRINANIERDKYLFSRSQMRGIELGRNILAEHKSHATRLQSELNILAKDKELLETKVRQITKEIQKFQEQAESLEVSMQQVCMAEVSLKSSIYSTARAAADVKIREKKSQLDDEFSSLILKISDRKSQLMLLDEKVSQIAKTKEQKDHDLRMLERKLVVLLEAQENELGAIRSKQKQKEGSVIQIGDASTSPTPTNVEQKAVGSVYQHSSMDSSKASKLMESTEAMMKFGFTSMTMTYFTALNMVKAMKSMSTHDIRCMGEDTSAPLPFDLQHASENQPLNKSIYAKKMKSPVSYWEVDHVIEWLKVLSLGQYEDSFRDGSVDGPFLCELSDDDLLHVLGVEHKLHRKKILWGIAKLKSLTSNDATNLNATQASITYATSSSPLDSLNTVKESPLDHTFTSSPDTSTAAQQQKLEVQIARRVTIAPVEINSIVQPSLDDLSRWVRNQKYTLLNEALAPFSSTKFDPANIRVQFLEGMGTVYVKSMSTTSTATEEDSFHLNRCDEHGNTLMHIAAQNGNLKIAKLLIEKGANPNHQNKQGQTPGHFAVAYQFFDFASWLFDKNGGNGDDLILNMYGLGPYDGLVDDDEEEEEADVVTEEEDE